MTRLLDRFMGRESVMGERMSPDASVFTTVFGEPNKENILPTFANAVTAFGSSGVVFSVELRRLMLFSEVEFKFQNLEDKHLYGGPGLSKLENPWPGGQTGDLLARMELHAGLAGNSYTRDAGSQLEQLRPDWTTIVSEITTAADGSEIRTVVGYVYTPPPNEGREPAYYLVDEVAHWAPIPDPTANFRGMSWLTPILREADADLQMTDYKRAYLTNAATPNLLIRYPTKVGSEKLNQLTAQIVARHGGVDNAFRTLALDEGADVTVLGSNFKDMAFSMVQAAGETRIASAGSVPAIVAGLKEGLDATSYAQYEQAMRAFADLYGRPSWRSACAALQKFTDCPDDSRLWYDTSGIAALRQGDKERADTVVVLSSALNTLIMAGYTPDAAVMAVMSADFTQLLKKHTGMLSVQMQQPGTETPKEGPV